jgi:hypothetical protein
MRRALALFLAGFGASCGAQPGVTLGVQLANVPPASSADVVNARPAPDISIAPANPAKWWGGTWRVDNRSGRAFVLPAFDASVEFGIDGVWLPPMRSRCGTVSLDDLRLAAHDSATVSELPVIDASEPLPTGSYRVTTLIADAAAESCRLARRSFEVRPVKSSAALREVFMHPEFEQCQYLRQAVGALVRVAGRAASIEWFESRPRTQDDAIGLAQILILELGPAAVAPELRHPQPNRSLAAAVALHAYSSLLEPERRQAVADQLISHVRNSSPPNARVVDALAANAQQWPADLFARLVSFLDLPAGDSRDAVWSALLAAAESPEHGAQARALLKQIQSSPLVRRRALEPFAVALAQQLHPTERDEWGEAPFPEEPELAPDTDFCQRSRLLLARVLSDELNDSSRLVLGEMSLEPSDDARCEALLFRARGLDPI